ncbi:hypothetical protein ACKU27_25290 [Sphingobium yanoikuyae]|uniref:hypothetical protein n=1 Tax=Sphingobium TaxID=165695 RepID=UPI00211DDBC3|nr:hypothetical protein [Sphingobium sp. IP1]
MPEKIRVVCPHCDATNAVPTDRQQLTAKCGRCHAVRDVQETKSILHALTLWLEA